MPGPDSRLMPNLIRRRDLQAGARSMLVAASIRVSPGMEDAENNVHPGP